MFVTPKLLCAVGATSAKADEICGAINMACSMYSIDTPGRIAAFLAQVGHESAGFRHTSELWGPTAAQLRYEGRVDLGNAQPGDGFKFRGHGFLQITGRSNHANVRNRLRARMSVYVPDFEAHPDKLAELPWAALSASDYWDMRRLNDMADAGDFTGITRRINGGLNGQADRLARWNRVKTEIAAQNIPAQPDPVISIEPPAQPNIFQWLLQLLAKLLAKRPAP